ncbi:MAG: hydrogenase maturation protease [Bacteroidota bacterium]
MKILLYGYGNPGRQDDDLGISAIDLLDVWIHKENLTDITLESNYQLNIEDAEIVSNHDLVIFIDATIEEIDRFICTEVKPDDATVEFTMHAVSPAYVLDLSNKLFKKQPETYLIHIKGYEWELGLPMTPAAETNLFAAVEFIKTKVLEARR